MFAGSVGKVPGVDGIGPLHQASFVIDPLLIGEDIVKGAFHDRYQRKNPLIVAGGLPGKPGSLDEPVLHVGFHRYADVFGPVFFFAGQLLRIGRHIVKDSPVGTLIGCKMVYGTFHVRIKKYTGSHHIGMIPDPKGFGIGRTVTEYRFAIDLKNQYIFTQKIPDFRNQIVKSAISSLYIGFHKTISKWLTTSP